MKIGLWHFEEGVGGLGGGGGGVEGENRPTGF